MSGPRYVTVFVPPVGLSFSASKALLCKLDATGNGTTYFRPILVGTLKDVAELVGALNGLDVAERAMSST